MPFIIVAGKKKEKWVVGWCFFGSILFSTVLYFVCKNPYSFSKKEPEFYCGGFDYLFSHLMLSLYVIE